MRFKVRFFQNLWLSSSFCLLLSLGIGLSTAPFFRFDLTDEKVYSLSEGSLSLLRSLENPVEIKLYVSKSIAELPPALQTHGRRVEEFLREFAGHAKGKLRVELIDPLPDSDDAVWAKKYGVRALPVGNGSATYLGAVFISGDREIAVPFFDPRKEDLLEFEVSEALAKLQNKQVAKIGIYSSLPVGANGSRPVDAAGQRLDWIFLERLKDFYEIEVFSMAPTDISTEIKTFILMHPGELDEASEFALEQFVLRGGRLVLIMDPLSRYELDRQLGSSMEQAPELSPRPSQLPRFIAQWGLGFSSGEIVGDLQQSSRVETMGVPRDNPFYLNLGATNLSQSSVITASLQQLLWVEGGAFDTTRLASELRYEPLIQSGEAAGLLPSRINSLADPEGATAQLGQTRRRYELAGLIRGRFRSTFTAVSEKGGALREAAEENSVLIIGDSDFLHEQYAIEGLMIGDQWVQKPRNDNINFLTNALAYLSGSSEIMRIRSSGRVQRPFTRLRKIQEAALARWQAEEQTLTQELEALRQRMGSLQAETKAEAEKGRPQQAAAHSDPAGLEMQSLRQEELKLRAQRREVRRKLREDIEGLGYRLKALNLLALPLVVSVLGILIYRRRYRV